MPKADSQSKPLTAAPPEWLADLSSVNGLYDVEADLESLAASFGDVGNDAVARRLMRLSERIGRIRGRVHSATGVVVCNYARDAQEAGDRMVAAAVAGIVIGSREGGAA